MVRPFFPARRCGGRLVVGVRCGCAGGVEQAALAVRVGLLALLLNIGTRACRSLVGGFAIGARSRIAWDRLDELHGLFDPCRHGVAQPLSPLLFIGALIEFADQPG